MQQFRKSCHVPQTCSIWGDGVQFDSQGVVGLSVVLQSVAVASTPIEEPLPTEHRSIRQVQPQVFSHLALLTLPATESREAETLVTVVLLFFLSCSHAKSHFDRFLYQCVNSPLNIYACILL